VREILADPAPPFEDLFHGRGYGGGLGIEFEVAENERVEIDDRVEQWTVLGKDGGVSAKAARRAM